MAAQTSWCLAQWWTASQRRVSPVMCIDGPFGIMYILWVLMLCSKINLPLNANIKLHLHQWLQQKLYVVCFDYIVLTFLVFRV